MLSSVDWLHDDHPIKGAKLAPSVNEWNDAKCEVCETGKQVNFSFGMESGSGMYLNLIFL